MRDKLVFTIHESATEKKSDALPCRKQPFKNTSPSEVDGDSILPDSLKGLAKFMIGIILYVMRHEKCLFDDLFAWALQASPVIITRKGQSVP